MNVATLDDPAVPPPAPYQDVEGIALVGLAHGTSHFFHLLLPPLFPMLASDYGFSYAELGLLVTVYFLISGVAQAMAPLSTGETPTRSTPKPGMAGP